MRNIFKNGILTGWVKAATIGILVATTVSAALSALTANLALSGKFGETGSITAVFLIRLLSVAIGGITGTSLSKEKLLPTIGVITSGYFIMLLIMGIIFYDGSFHQFGSGLLSTLLGGVLVGLIRLRSRKSKRRTVKIHR